MQTRRWCAALIVALCVTVPVSAELKYTYKMTMKKVEGPAPQGMFAAMGDMMGPMIDQVFGGAEGVDVVVTVHQDGRMRSEYLRSYSGMPAGSVVLLRGDGSSVGYDPKAGTWWKMTDGLDEMPPEMQAMLAQMKPVVSVKKTGERQAIAGLASEKSLLSIRMPIPLPPGVDLSQVPPELAAMIPKEITVDADVWLSPQYGKYSSAMLDQLTKGPFAQFGIKSFDAEQLAGFTTRMNMRMSVMPGYEMEMLVSTVGEETAPAAAFELPAGLKEIPMPQPAIR